MEEIWKQLPDDMARLIFSKIDNSCTRRELVVAPPKKINLNKFKYLGIRGPTFIYSHSMKYLMSVQVLPNNAIMWQKYTNFTVHNQNDDGSTDFMAVNPIISFQFLDRCFEQSKQMTYIHPIYEDILFVT